MGLCALIRDGLGFDLESNECRHVAELCVKYLIGTIPAYEFQHKIKTVDITETDYSGKTFRLKLLDNAYFILNLKYAALNLAVHPVNAKHLHDLEYKFGIKRNDVVLLKRLFSRQTFRSNIRSTQRLKEIHPAQITAGAMNNARDAFVKMQSDVMRHIRRGTYKKLRFVANAENSELRDLDSEVLTKALRVYYMMVPTQKSDAHVLNYLRRTCSNHVQNVIKLFTTEKRGRMKNDGEDGYGGNSYGLVIVSENQAVIDPENEQSYESVLTSTNMEDTTRIESEVGISRLINSYKGRKRKALQILSGQYDEKFTKWLVARGRIKDHEDQHDFQSRVAHTTFIRALAEYLGVIFEAFQRFVQQIGERLKSHLVYA